MNEYAGKQNVQYYPQHVEHLSSIYMQASVTRAEINSMKETGRLVFSSFFSTTVPPLRGNILFKYSFVGKLPGKLAKGFPGSDEFVIIVA